MSGATALYRHFDESGALLYVGISLSAMQRMEQHRDRSGWFDQIANVKIERYPTRQDALRAEENAIRSERPKYNVVHNGVQRAPISRAIEDELHVLLNEALQLAIDGDVDERAKRKNRKRIMVLGHDLYRLVKSTDRMQAIAERVADRVPEHWEFRVDILDKWWDGIGSGSDIWCS